MASCWRDTVEEWEYYGDGPERLLKETGSNALFVSNYATKSELRAFKKLLKSAEEEWEVKNIAQGESSLFLLLDKKVVGFLAYDVIVDVNLEWDERDNGSSTFDTEFIERYLSESKSDDCNGISFCLFLIYVYVAPQVRGYGLARLLGDRLFQQIQRDYLMPIFALLTERRKRQTLRTVLFADYESLGGEAVGEGVYRQFQNFEHYKILEKTFRTRRVSFEAEIEAGI